MKKGYSESIRWQIEQASSRYLRHEKEREQKEAYLNKLRTARKEGETAQVDWSKIDEPKRVLRRLGSLGMGEAVSEALLPPDARPAAPEISLYERILDRNNLSDVALLYELAAVSRAVGRIQVRTSNGKTRWQGTGFLVSPSLILTNNHVLQNEFQAGKAVIQFDYYDTIRGFRNRVQEYHLQPKRFFETNARLDFSLVAISPVSTENDSVADLGWIPLIRESGKAVVGEPVNIIQHPGGNPKQVVIRDNHLIDVPDDFLHYKADTEPGSSGSPVLNDNCELAALHHSGVPKRDDNNSILLIDGTAWDGSDQTVHLISWIANEGVRISRIVSHLDGLVLSPAKAELYADCFRLSPPPPELVLSGLQAEEEGTQEASSTQGAGTELVDPNLPRTEEDGSVSWFLRVNVGPFPAPSANPVQNLPAAGSNVTSQPPATAEVPGNTNLPQNSNDASNSARARAEEVVENAWAGRPYYDEVADKAASDQYYDQIDSGADKDAFFDQLSSLVSETQHTSFSYKKARWDHLYPWIDRHPSGNLRNIYSGTILDPAEILAQEIELYERAVERAFSEGLLSRDMDESIAEDKIESILLESSHPFNCEHIVPQSWFDYESVPKTDLHHLVACESGCNSFRGNYAYYDFDPLDEAVRTDCGKREDNPKRFEPEFGKGVVARATLYFLMRYPGEVFDGDSEFPKSRIKDLIRWHKAYKVDKYELHRNAAIAEVQGNRNPLIDFPSWVNKINFERGLGT